MTGELTVFTLDSDGLDRVLLMLILLGIAAVICFLISLAAMVSSNWKTASTFAVLTDMFGLIWTNIHPVLLLFMFAYTALVLVGAYVKGSKTNQQQNEPQNEAENEEYTDDTQQTSDDENERGGGE